MSNNNTTHYLKPIQDTIMKNISTENRGGWFIVVPFTQVTLPAPCTEPINAGNKPEKPSPMK